jgi:hypothetical protein
MKKEKDNEVIVKTILNKMLEKYGVDVDYVMEHQKIDGKNWFQYYTMTTTEYNAWKEWTMEYLKSTHIRKELREKEFMWFNLMWGLKIKEDDDTTG